MRVLLLVALLASFPLAAEPWDSLEREAIHFMNPWTDQQDSVVEAFNSYGEHLASIQMNPRRTEIRPYFTEFHFHQVSSDQKQQALALFAVVSDLNADAVFIRLWGYPRLANLTVLNGSVFGLVWTGYQGVLNGVSGAVGGNLRGAQMKLNFRNAVLMKFGGSPQILKVYSLPIRQPSVGHHVLSEEVQTLIADYAYSELRTRFSSAPEPFCDRILSWLRVWKIE